MNDYGELPIQEVGALVSGAIWLAVSIGAVVAWRMNGTAPPALRYGMSALWLLTSLRMYSATSYIWGEDANRAGLFPALRAGVLVVLTLVLILVLALVTYYWRRWRRER